MTSKPAARKYSTRTCQAFKGSQLALIAQIAFCVARGEQFEYTYKRFFYM